MQYNENVSVLAIRYDIKYGDKATDCYKRMTESFHTDLKVEKTGLHIIPEIPYLEASPDGIVS